MNTSRRPSTLHDVAAQVGVSPRTVSRVVRNEGGFSESTRQRVMAAVEELNYRPNAHARGLISGRTNTMAFVVPVLSDPFFPELVEGVHRAARTEGYNVLFAMSDDDPVVQGDILNSIESHRPEGVVIFPAGEVELLLPFLDRGVPMVVIDAVIDHPRAISVHSDLAGGARAAVDHLIARGCRQLAMFDRGGMPVKHPRRRAFEAAIPDGMDLVVIDARNTMEGGRHAMIELTSARPDVDGVFCLNDVMAIGAIGAARDLGRSVPDDVAVIGFDDIQMGAVVTPALTTVRIDRGRVGAEAMRRLIGLANHQVEQSSIVLPVELVVRASA